LIPKSPAGRIVFAILLLAFIVGICLAPDILAARTK
jgi:hypothetical protein